MEELYEYHNKYLIPTSLDRVAELFGSSFRTAYDCLLDKLDKVYVEMYQDMVIHFQELNIEGPRQINKLLEEMYGIDPNVNLE